jgi:hypothetical protein
MTALASTSPRALPAPFLTAALAACAAAFAPAQSVTYTARNGGNLVASGALVGGPFIHHTFLTPVPTHDPIAVSDPGGGGLPASNATAQFDATATSTGFSLVFAGTADRGGPPAVIVALVDCRDQWQFTITTAMRFTLNASLTAASTEATVPPCHFTFQTFGGGAAIVPDPGSPPAPYQQTLSAPGSVAVAASGTMLPGTYLVNVFGRSEGTTWPYAGSFTTSLALTFQPAATVATRTAFGNPSSYTCTLPVLGQTWHANVDVGSTSHTFAMVFASLAPAQVPAGPGFTVLLGGPVLEFLPITAGPQAAYSLALPATPSLAGAQLFTQALHFGGAPSLLLSNAKDLTLGF